jgi:hypothetical protein
MVYENIFLLEIFQESVEFTKWKMKGGIGSIIIYQHNHNIQLVIPIVWDN